MSNYRILASDLDGTLLNSRGVVSEENQAAIRDLTESGVYFVPSSGRTLFEIPSMIRDNPFVRYIIHSDGAVVHDKQTGERLDMSMPWEKVSVLLDVLSEYDVSMTVRHQGRSYTAQEWFCDEAGIYYRLNDTWQEFIYDYSTPVEDFQSFCRGLESVEMICVFFHSQDELEACRARLMRMGTYEVTSSDPANLEIIDVGVGKGEALLRLAEHLGVDPSATIAVGDSPNDRNMIEKAGLGLAMENACTELKALADATACHCDRHVVRYIMDTYL